MKRTIGATIYIAFLFIASAVGVGGFSTQTMAQATPKAAIVAIVDSRRLFTESLVSKDIRKQLIADSQALAAKENTTKDQLLKEKADLDKQKTVLVQEAYEAKYNQLKQQADELNRNIEMHRQQLNVAQAKANQQLQRVLEPIIAQIAQKRGATIVFEKSQVIWQAGGLDITTGVIEELDKQLPTLKVVLPTEDEVMQMINQARQQQQQQ